MGEDNYGGVGKVRQMGLYIFFMMFSLKSLLLVVHPLEFSLELRGL